MKRVAGYRKDRLADDAVGNCHWFAIRRSRLSTVCKTTDGVVRVWIVFVVLFFLFALTLGVVT